MLPGWWELERIWLSAILVQGSGDEDSFLIHVHGLGLLGPLPFHVIEFLRILNTNF